MPTGDTPLPVPGSVGQSLAFSYGKRQMFVYGVEDSAAGQPHPINASRRDSNPLANAQMMAAALENSSPKAIYHSLGLGDEDDAVEEHKQ